MLNTAAIVERIEKIRNNHQLSAAAFASKIANAYEFINEYEEKYKYNVGDNWSNLSGGQKQRIAISRAVISNSPILILDESTSALDALTEEKVLNSIFQTYKD